jgi:sterol desaturase/sphingolipid hydroxylase (fatty acid hydroxylase superfamily)
MRIDVLAMNFVEIAIPFFILAMLAELAYGAWKQHQTYRLNDAVASLMMGSLSQLMGVLRLSFSAVVFTSAVEFAGIVPWQATAWWHWVAAFIAYDFCYYWKHRCGHEWRIMWASHSAHHQSEEYNLSTALRQTSTDYIGFVFYLPMYLAGTPVYVMISVGTLNLVYQFWVHTQHVDRMGMLDYLLVTPSNHRVHHAKNPRYIDKNYGGFLIVWDRLFGTFCDEQRDEKPIYGITHGLRSWNPIWANAVVWWDTLILAVKAPRWRDKISVWFKGPGWFPQGLEPSREDPLGWHEHYDPQAPQSSKAYVFAQYWVLTGAGFALIASQAELAQPALVANFALIAGSMYVASLWLEHRQYRFWADGARAGLMLSAGLWMPLLSQNVAGWVWALQVLGIANAVLLIGLYWLQQGQGETTAAN